MKGVLFILLLLPSICIYAQDLLFPNEVKQGNVVDLTVNVTDNYAELDNAQDVSIKLTPASWYDQNGNRAEVIESESFYSDQTIFSSIALNNDAAIGSYNLAVFGDGEIIFEIQDALNVTSGEKMSISSANFPSNISRNKILDVTISGSNTQFTKEPDLLLSFSQGTDLLPNSAEAEPFSQSIEILSDTKLVAHIAIPYNAPIADYDLIVTGALSGEMLFEDAFSVVSNQNIPKATCSGKKSLMKSESTDLWITGQNLNMQHSENNTLLFYDIENENLYQGDSPYPTLNSPSFKSFGFQAQGNNIGKAAVLIPEIIVPGDYRVYFSNPICGAVATDMVVTITNQMAIPDVTMSPCFAKNSEDLDITISAKNRFFAQATEVTPIISATISKNETVIDCEVKEACFFSFKANVRVPYSAPAGSYNLTLQLKNPETGVVSFENHEDEFIIAHPLDETEIKEYANIYEGSDSTHIFISPTITEHSNLEGDITLDVFLGEHKTLPEWCKYDTAQHKLSIATNRFKAWETISIIILAEDSKGNQDAFSFSTDVFYVTDDYLYNDYGYATNKKSGSPSKNTPCAVFPNPATDQITIGSDKRTDFTYSIYSTDGKFVYKAESANQSIPTNHLPQGNYYIKCTGAEFSCSENFSIK